MPTCCGMHVKFPNKELSVDHLLFCTLSVCKYLRNLKKEQKENIDTKSNMATNGQQSYR